MGFPEKNSETFYGLVMSDADFEKVATKIAKQPAEDRYKLARKDKTLQDSQILDIIYKSENTGIREKIIGKATRKEFETHLLKCIPLVKEKDLQDVLTFKSFPETYFHPILADALAEKKVLTTPGEGLVERIAATGMYLFLYEEKQFLSTALMVGLSHSISRSMYGGGKYTEETVAYTLLTFSYFAAKKLNVKDEDWFFYWKVFGSLMGLGVGYLPDNYDKAKALMGDIHKKSCYPAKKLTENQKALLEAYLETFEEDDILKKYILDDKKPTFSDLCSSRMSEYLKESGRVGKSKKESKK